ncbi:FAD-dependent monooxygenase [Legionella lansingensis]|uniref:FAD-dependent monooxygenase n=1 Tax=Legionella lansingensis TaxID=45067 RepID=UPI000AC4DD1B|nr:FAD-dependent monooxygenase [Legionella lansingensis]
MRQNNTFISKGKKYPSHYIIADVLVEGNFNPEHWYFFLAKHGFASISGLPDKRWGVLVSLPKKEALYERGKQPTLDELQSYFDNLSAIPGKLSDLRWISHFHTYLKSVDNRKQGRVILCGDAAHQVSPLTSLGMNSGLLYAGNLGWKLALVC